MYLMYVDESGDPGPKGSGGHFVLSSLVIHESRWVECFRMVKDLRVALRDQFGIRRNGELHANNNIANRGVMFGKRWPLADRIRLFQLVMETIAQLPSTKSINICIRKSAPALASVRGHAVYEVAWKFLLQRFHNFVEESRGGRNVEGGMVIHDSGHEVEVRKLMRKLRVYNPVPSRFGGPPRNIPLLSLLEDPVPRSSFHAQFIQLCDYIAFTLLRRDEPVAKYPGLDHVFEMLRPVFLLEAARNDPCGVVRYPTN